MSAARAPAHGEGSSSEAGPPQVIQDPEPPRPKCPDLLPEDKLEARYDLVVGSLDLTRARKAPFAGFRKLCVSRDSYIEASKAWCRWSMRQLEGLRGTIRLDQRKSRSRDSELERLRQENAKFSGMLERIFRCHGDEPEALDALLHEHKQRYAEIKRAHKFLAMLDDYPPLQDENLDVVSTTATYQCHPPQGHEPGRGIGR